MTDLILRQATVDDIPELSALSDRMTRRCFDRPTWLTPDVMTTTFEMPGRDPARDFPLVLRDGRVLGSGAVNASPPYTEITVFPLLERDLAPTLQAEVVRLLVSAALDAARSHVAGQPVDADRMLMLAVFRADTDVTDHLPALGLEVVRQNFEMMLDVPDGASPEPMWPPGTTTRTFEDDDAITDASVVLAEAFLDHHGDYVMTEEQLRHVVDTPRGRRDASFVAYDARGPLGAVLSIDDVDGGYVASLGVARRARGQGLGEALLRAAIARFAETGAPRVCLDVDAENITGATRLYERVGMQVRTVLDMWGMPLER